MIDISKCVGSNCKIKGKCDRYIARSNNNWQSYTDFSNKKQIKNKNQCIGFLEIFKEK